MAELARQGQQARQQPWMKASDIAVSTFTSKSGKAVGTDAFDGFAE
jgi:hypothetical protein